MRKKTGSQFLFFAEESLFKVERTSTTTKTTITAVKASSMKEFEVFEGHFMHTFVEGLREYPDLQLWHIIPWQPSLHFPKGSSESTPPRHESGLMQARKLSDSSELRQQPGFGQTFAPPMHTEKEVWHSLHAMTSFGALRRYVPASQALHFPLD
ncbi:hypothetical protein FGO68_gene15127 [Halteria grandinella]|uniref:Uncharacterized protein n=1 Tax=Halteria grandinella TaxID=5974 RepID=A0A8J8TAV5_HALGN|nr:hypothetical protein FGO68_gene15127 [Halteria grandinella]